MALRARVKNKPGIGLSPSLFSSRLIKGHIARFLSKHTRFLLFAPLPASLSTLEEPSQSGPGLPARLPYPGCRGCLSPGCHRSCVDEQVGDVRGTGRTAGEWWTTQGALPGPYTTLGTPSSLYTAGTPPPLLPSPHAARAAGAVPWSRVTRASQEQEEYPGQSYRYSPREER